MNERSGKQFCDRRGDVEEEASSTLPQPWQPAWQVTSLAGCKDVAMAMTRFGQQLFERCAAGCVLRVRVTSCRRQCQLRSHLQWM